MKTKLFLLLTLFVMLTQSCTKDPVSTNGTPITKYEYLTAGALNQTPYFTNPAFDTISFASDKGDTITFVKTRTDSSWYCEKQSFVTDYKICYQTIHNSYITINGVGSFDVRHCKKTETGYPDNINIGFNDFGFHINQNWLSPSFGYGNFIGEYSVKNRNFHSTIFVSAILGDTTTSRLILNSEFGGITILDKLSDNSYTLIKP